MQARLPSHAPGRRVHMRKQHALLAAVLRADDETIRPRILCEPMRTENRIGKNARYFDGVRRVADVERDTLWIAPTAMSQ